MLAPSPELGASRGYDSRMTDGWDIVVLGAGAAGLVAALRAAELGRRVLLLEKNRKPGVKILTRALARSEGRMKVVSDRLNCSASACILGTSSVCARSKTHKGLPLSAARAWVKTLTMR